MAKYEPHTALSGGVDGLDAYKSLIPHIKRLLMDSGVALLELGCGQAADVRVLAEGAGLQVLEVRADLGGIERCMVLGHAER